MKRVRDLSDLFSPAIHTPEIAGELSEAQQQHDPRVRRADCYLEWWHHYSFGFVVYAVLCRVY
jgi:hypothetical protein